MKLRLLVLAGLAVVFAAVPSQATTIPPNDPSIIVIPGGGTTPEGLHFTINVPGDTHSCTVTVGSETFSAQCFELVNSSGLDWTGLDFLFPSTSNVSCLAGTGTVFSSCSASGTEIVFSGGLISTSIDHVTLVFVNWPTTTFDVTAIVPEPATLGLFLTGISGLIAGRRLRRRLGLTQKG